MASCVLPSWALCDATTSGAAVAACGGGGASPSAAPLSPCEADDRDAPAPAWSLNDEALMWDTELVRRARAHRRARRGGAERA
jgi:hypothetical protein